MTVVDVQAAGAVYRVTVLGTGLMRMWRGWRIVLPAVLVNALVQGMLLLPGFLPYPSIGFIVGSLVGLIVLILMVGATAAVMLQAATGPVRSSAVLAAVRARLWPLLGWSAVLVIAATIGVSLYVLPGLVILALTPFLLLAVMDGQSHPLRRNFRVLGARWGRWLVTVIIMSLIVLVLWLLSALDGFFVTGSPAGIIGWLGLGLVLAWFTCAWALVYRSVEPVVASTE